MREEVVYLRLNPNEALVLFEFLTRYSDQDRLEIADQAEQRVLWDIQCMLEAHVDTINNPNYEMEIELARAAVRDRTE